MNPSLDEYLPLPKYTEAPQQSPFLLSPLSETLLHLCIVNMGERFQVYLIARSQARTPQRFRYQCIGAYHHQWCFETMPLRALHRFFTLLRQDENVVVVRDELRLLARTLEDVKPPLYNPAVPCPYTLSLLAISWTTDLEHQTFLSSNSFTAGLMDAREPCWEKGHCDSHSWYVVQ